jgi:transposase-like protein
VEAQRRNERRKFKQALAVDLLASGMTVSEAARKIGVDRRTIYRWFNDPVFMAELEDRRQELIDSMLDQRLLASRMATAKLVESMESSNEAIALRAAIELFREGLRAYHTIDERKRIERLEDHLKIIYGWGR